MTQTSTVMVVRELLLLIVRHQSTRISSIQYAVLPLFGTEVDFLNKSPILAITDVGGIIRHCGVVQLDE